MKKRLLFICILCISIGYSYSILASSPKSNYEIYNNRVNKICKEFELKDQKITNNFIEYENYDTTSGPSEPIDFEGVKKSYKTNMNNIYQCAILSTQIKTINLIIQDLSGSDTEIKKEMRSQIKKLNMSMKTLKCNNTNTKNSIQKSKVLTQTTYQTCKYHSYLEYIRKHNRSLAQLPRIKEEQIFSIHEISEIQKEAFTEIDKEIENIYKIFPIAYQAYSEYENNILAHYMLQIIKKDYHSLRQNLHDTLNPMNQLIYKVSNATKP